MNLRRERQRTAVHARRDRQISRDTELSRLTMPGIDELLEEQNSAEEKIFEYSLTVLRPLYEKRQALVSTIPGFWSSVLEASELLAEYITYEDTEAIDSLKDIHIDWDADNVKNFTISLTFGDNSYLESTVLKKRFVYNADLQRHVSEKVEISWKPGKNLTNPRPGRDTSFFNWFAYEGTDENDDEGSEIAQIIRDDLYPHALDLYRNAQQDTIEPEYDISESDVEEES